MSKYLAPALDKGLDIIEYLSEKAVPQSQIEIAQGIGKTSNEIYRMLVRLEERGYLNKDAVSGKYTLSLKLYHISHRHTPMDELIRSSKPVMQDLSNEIKQSCHLSILYGNELMVVSQTRSPGPVSLSIEEGGLFPLLKTTSGRVLLAFAEKRKLKKILSSDNHYKSLSANDKTIFLSKLDEIKQKGYEMCESEITKGVTDIAVPVGLDKTGVFGVLAVSSLYSVTNSDKNVDNIIDKIQNAANLVNQAIGSMSTTIPTE